MKVTHKAAAQSWEPTGIVVRFENQFESYQHVVTITTECEGKVSVAAISVGPGGVLHIEDMIKHGKPRVLTMKQSLVAHASQIVRALLGAA